MSRHPRWDRNREAFIAGKDSATPGDEAISVRESSEKVELDTVGVEAVGVTEVDGGVVVEAENVVVEILGN